MRSPSYSAVISKRECAKVSLVVFVLLGIAILALVAHFGFFLEFAIESLYYPFGLDYGEGIVWQQAILIPGERMYGDINHFPFIVFHYPPVYHLVVRMVAKFGLDFLLVGRCVSLLSSLVSSAMIVSITFSVLNKTARLPIRLAGAAVSGLTFFCCVPVVYWSALMRVDMLAVALSYCGVLLTLGHTKQQWQSYLAMVLFTLSIFTKQTCIVAPLTTLLMMVLTNIRSTKTILCFGLVLAAVALAAMMLATGGGFLKHIISYNIHRYSIQAATLSVVVQLAVHFGFFSLAILGCFLGWQRIMADRAWFNFESFRCDLVHSDCVRSFATLTLYCCLLALSSASLGKSGAAINYLIEWMGALSVFVGIAVALVAEQELRNFGNSSSPSNSILALILPFALFIQTAIIPVSRDQVFLDHTRTRELDDLVSRIRNADTPVLSDDNILLMKAGKGISWESATFAELSTTGRWNESRIIDMLNGRRFAFVITEGHKGDTTFDSRYTPAVALALENVYPLKEGIAGLTVRSPEM